ncbi:MAG: hypothetical protein NWR54_00230 [Paracoccaceae bacterium]|nr:hypothetical protein [Paracoccaceae bacterium]
MKTSILTALAAVVLGTSAYADVNDGTLSSRATPSDIVVFERDKGVYGAATTTAKSAAASLVDASKVLLPREQAIATNGKVAVYSFNTKSSDRDLGKSFPRR